MDCVDAASFVLEQHFQVSIGDRYDPAFSRENLRFLLPLMGNCSVRGFIDKINDFARENQARWIRIVNERRNFTDCSYLLQPELILIFYLIDKDPYSLYQVLDEHISESDIDQIFNWWGISADDFRVD